MENKYNEWDVFIGHLMLCQIAALKQKKNFILMDMDPKELYDNLFYKVLGYAEKMDKQFHVYFYGDNIFKFLRYKLKDKSAKFLSPKKCHKLESVHYCMQAERAGLIKTLAAAHNVELSDLPKLYEEYYLKIK